MRAFFKHYLKIIINPAYRKNHHETQRLLSLPRYTPTKTLFIGKQIDLVDAATFLSTKYEIFTKGMYEFKSESNTPFIIDCGANIGLSVIYFKTLYPKVKIVAFEPDKHIFSVLGKNIATFGFSDVKLYQQAIWDSDTEIEFHVEGGCSGRIPKPGDVDNIVKIKTKKLKTLLYQNVDFLKMDIEGAEYRVLLDCNEKLLNVKNIFIEYHSHVKEKQTLHEILDILSANGFRYHIHEAYTNSKPYIDRELMLGMDLQLNIFGYRNNVVC